MPEVACRPCPCLPGGVLLRAPRDHEPADDGDDREEPTAGYFAVHVRRDPLCADLHDHADCHGQRPHVIEHSLNIIRNADWVIDIGPEGSSKGGRVLFEGTLRELVSASDSLTSQFV